MARGGGERRETKTGSAGQPSAMPKRRNSYERLLKPKSKWWDEEQINGHAMFLGCLLMAVRGLGFLMLTWITVVLLGGFVTNLGTVDFWALTVIALLQIIGVFSLFQEIMKYRDIGNFGPNLFPDWLPSVGRWFASVDRWFAPADSYMLEPPRRDNAPGDPNCCLSLIVAVIFLIAGVPMVVVMLAVTFLLLAFSLGVLLFYGIVIFLFVTVVQYGPVIVAIWSMVRVLVVRAHFFTSASDGPGVFGSNAGQLPNLIPAVDAAYWLGVAQGAVLLCWHLCHLGRTRTIKSVSRDLELETDTVRRYCHETAAGSEKDLTFAVGRNLITYAVELLESKHSPDKFLSGICILGTFIRQGPFPDGRVPAEQSELGLLGRLVLIKQLVTGSESFGHLIEELLQTLGPRSPYGMEIRGHAARIVLLVAHKIYLDEHPRCIQCVSSLLDPIGSKQNPPYGYQRAWQLRDTPYERDWCLEWYERDLLVETCWKKKKSSDSGDEGDESQCNLQAEGYMDMLWLGLSILEKLAADEHNCSVMSSTDGLLPRIMVPLCCNVLHLDRVDHQAWGRIVSASHAVMHRLAQAPGEDGKTLRSKISGNQDAIRTIVECILQCQTCPALEKGMELLTLLCMDAALGMQETTKGFIQFLFNTLADSNCKEKIRTLAGRKLAVLSVSSQRAEIILTSDGILDSLKDIFLSQPRSTLGIIAVEIMDHICGGNYTVDGECHRNMKNAMKAVMPQVLMELFHCDSSTGETTPTGIQGGVEPLETEASIAPDDIENRITSQGNSQIASSPSHQQNREAEQKENVEWNKALLSLSVMFFDKFASDDDQNLLSLLDEVAPKLTKMADANTQPTADSLRIMKLITNLVISVVRHGYLTEGVDNLMTSLTTASNKMLNLDGLLLCSGVEGGANRTFSTLCSLVKEAQKLVDSCNAREGSMVQDSSPGNN